MKRWIGLAVAGVVLFSGVAYAADTVAPTLADVYKAVIELKADVAQLKTDGFTRANASGKLASATSADGKVTLEVTSLMAGPDATVVGVKITNASGREIRMNTTFDLSLVAGGRQIKILEDNGLTDEVLPATSSHGLLLLEPLPKDVKEVTLRAKLYDTNSYDDVLEPTLVIKVGN